MTRSTPVPALTIEVSGWDDYAIIVFLALVGVALFIVFLRGGGGPRGH